MEVKRKFNLRRTIAEVLESGKLGEEKLHQDNWLQLIQLYAIITGVKPQQGRTVTVPKMKPRGRSPAAVLNKVIKAEQQRKQAALAANAAAEEAAKGEQK